LKQLADEELFAMSDTDFDVAYTLSPIEPIPTGWNTKVENPGDRKLTPKERQYNTELARHQGGQPTYPTSSLVAPTAAIDYVYSAKRKRRSK
jgi:hypothetical protein